MHDLIAVARALLAYAVLRALNALPQPPAPPEPPAMHHPADRIIARAFFAQPDAAALDAYRSDVTAGLWNRWYDGEEPTMDAPVGGVAWARRLGYEDVVALAKRIGEEYSV